MTWSQHDFTGPVAAVIADRGRFVAVGGEHDRLTAWTSADGTAWEAQEIPGPSTEACDPAEPICLERAPVLGPLVRLGDTLYSFGGTQFFNDAARAVAWRWTDGQEWQVIESASQVFSAGPFRTAAASNSAIFAVTHAGYPLTERHWLWNAETSWREVGEPISTENPDEFRAVAWTEGQFVAVGTAAEVDPDIPYWEWPISAAIWTSPDGATWTSIPPPPTAETLCEIRALGDFFAFGVADGGSAVWRSANGVDWQGGLLPGAEGMAGCPGTVIEVADGFVALLPAGARTLVWTSVDGSKWQASDDLPIPTHLDSFAAIDGTIVAFADRDPGSDEAVPIVVVGSVSAQSE